MIALQWRYGLVCFFDSMRDYGDRTYSALHSGTAERTAVAQTFSSSNDELATPPRYSKEPMFVFYQSSDEPVEPLTTTFLLGTKQKLPRRSSPQRGRETFWRRRRTQSPRPVSPCPCRNCHPLNSLNIPPRDPTQRKDQQWQQQAQVSTLAAKIPSRLPKPNPPLLVRAPKQRAAELKAAEHHISLGQGPKTRKTRGWGPGKSLPGGGSRAPAEARVPVPDVPFSDRALIPEVG